MSCYSKYVTRSFTTMIADVLSMRPKEKYNKTRKQNLQANSRSACQFWHKREKAQRLFAKLHILSLLQEVEIELIFALPYVYGPQFLRYCLIFSISIFGHGIWNLRKGPKVVYVLYFYHGRSKLSLFLFYGHSFSRYEPIFKNSIFGHEFRNLKKGPKVACVLSFYLRG